MSACVSSSIRPVSTALRRPDARVAVGLELAAHGLALRPLPVAADVVEHAELVLHVVAVLVRDHVRLRERPAAGAEARLQLVEEAEVDVDHACRAGSRRGRPASSAKPQPVWTWSVKKTVST